MSEPVLSVRGLTKSFGALPVAQAIDLDLAPGARVGLIGPNGAGKTTFVNLLTGLVPPDAGTVTLAGTRIEELPPERRVGLGLVRTHQINTLLVETNARDNVAIAIAEREGIARRLMRYGRTCALASRRPTRVSQPSASAMWLTVACRKCPTAASACLKSPSPCR